ncbi:hypothetical protein ASD24_11230 [Paenibacillus sp. Root52]|uniref:Heme/steroid binding protein n=1 Tax=Paenibacillus amylolyticus TaxID=1451 RepID=A0AAP5LNV8_PAEAM|nr:MULTISPECIES: hypothetical protein [Paenibacillus]KQY84318.1 hypothetical protein ASD24_11230 [Paenibacillus sp. Root52]MDR6724085.1 putative heme/steroid binding protein [Paenibacillus amylolyticus]
MNKWLAKMQRSMGALLICALVGGATLVGGAEVQAATLSQSSVYYDSDGVLYKVTGDGSETTEVLIDYEGTDPVEAGSYLYYLPSNNSTTLLRVPNDGSSDAAETYATGVLDYYTDNGFIYYLDTTGQIYRANGNSAASSATKIADKADTEFPMFSVNKGRIYYNGLVNGNTWFVSKASNGSGAVQRIASGAVESRYLVNEAKNELQVMLNTDPYEDYYSTNAMVLYKVNYNTGKGTAVNPKSKLDVNAVYSGGWGNNLYVYNKGIVLDSNKDYNYSTGKAFALTSAGKTFQVHSKSVREVTALGTDKVIIIDADKKAYGKTFASNKVSKSTTLNLNNVTYASNQYTNSTPTTVYISGNNGLYSVTTAFKVTKLTGEEWDTFLFRNNVPGVFYINADDLYRLYHVNANGTGKKALSDVYLDDIRLVTSK